jgi:uncharacterized membrane protein
MLGVVVFSSVDNATDSMMNESGYATATATVDNISETYYDSIELSVVGIIVLAAALTWLREVPLTWLGDESNGY